MARGKSVSARERARAARAQLEVRRRQQRDFIESHQVAYFAACDDIDAVRNKITALEEELAALKAREADDTAQARHRAEMAMGALVVEAGQPIDDVAVLLDAAERDVRKARAAYRTLHRASGAKGSGQPTAAAAPVRRPMQTSSRASENHGPENAGQELT